MTLAELLATADYAGLSDSEAAVLANQKRHISTHRVTYLGLANVLDADIVRRLISTIKAVAANDSLVSEIRNFLRGDGVDVGHATTRAMLDAFSADVNLPLTEDDAMAVKALAENQISDAELYGLGVVRVGHIVKARS